MASGGLRFGLVGFGAWGECHARAITGTSGVELAGIHARSARSRQRAKESFASALVVDDYRKLVSRSDIDVIDIVVPSDAHFEIASAALEAGKHVLLEKPMALRVDDCRSLISQAQSKGLVLAIGHELRLSPLWGRVKGMIDEGVIGQPLYVLVELSRRPYRTGSDGWRYQIDRVGSWILEEPIHFFDLARWYLSGDGDPETVYANGNSRQSGHPELLDNFSAIVKFGGGAYAVVTQTLAAFEHHQTVKVTGTEGCIWASWSGAMDRVREARQSLRVQRDEGTVEDVVLDSQAGELHELDSEIAMMARAVRGEGIVAASGEDGLRAVSMCLAAEASARSGAVVAIA